MKLNPFFVLSLTLLLALSSCKESKENPTPIQNSEASPHSGRSKTALKRKLIDDGYQIFDYFDASSGDTILMQQYFIAFLKKGKYRSQTKEEGDSLQRMHLAHLGRMYKEGYADISGPFGDDGDIRGITIYNVPTLEIADSLANLDPMVKAERLVVEIHPWWAAKGFHLR